MSRQKRDSFAVYCKTKSRHKAGFLLSMTKKEQNFPLQIWFHAIGLSLLRYIPSTDFDVGDPEITKTIDKYLNTQYPDPSGRQWTFNELLALPVPDYMAHMCDGLHDSPWSEGQRPDRSPEYKFARQLALRKAKEQH